MMSHVIPYVLNPDEANVIAQFVQIPDTVTVFGFFKWYDSQFALFNYPESKMSQEFSAVWFKNVLWLRMSIALP